MSPRVDAEPRPHRRVLVVDDEMQESYWFDRAFPGEHECLTSVADLRRALDAGDRWDVAFVDFHLGLDVPSGLTAAHLLCERDVPVLAYTRLGESGRVLYAAATVAWSGARGVIDKELVNDSMLMEVVRVVVDGYDPTLPRLRRRLPDARWLNGLLRIERDVSLWRAWAQFRGDEAAIMTYLHETPDTIRGFRERAYEAVEGLLQQTDAYTLPPGRKDYRGVLSDFAARHRRFFDARDLAATIKRRGTVPRQRVDRGL